jgi:endoglucanase
VPRFKPQACLSGIGLRIALLLIGLLGTVLASPSLAGPRGFHLSSTRYFVHEHARAAVITVVRGDTRSPGRVGYIALGTGFKCNGAPCSAMWHYDFVPVKGILDFPAGVARESFYVPIIDHHQRSVPKTMRIALFFGSWPNGLAGPSAAVLTIVNDDLAPARDPGNPLELRVPPRGGNPLAGARFYVDPFSSAAKWSWTYPALEAIASQPGVARFGKFSGPDPGLAVNDYLATASQREPGTVPMLSTYRVVDGHCGHWADPPADQASYQRFISRFAEGIGTYPAVLFLEMDALITSPCLTPHGLSVRMRELHRAIDTLVADCPHLVIYLDAGAADAVPAGPIARMLLRAGVSEIQGFFLNSTHYDWTSHEIVFGERISRMIGGKHFVVSTGDSGRGPLKPPDPAHEGNEILCNPPGRGLGPRPTSRTGFSGVDAFAWVDGPGESGGSCGRGDPPRGFWPAYALMLVRNAVYTVDHHYL